MTLPILVALAACGRPSAPPPAPSVSSSDLTPADDAIVATVGGTALTWKDVKGDGAIELEVKKGAAEYLLDRYTMLYAVAESAALEKALQAEADKTGFPSIDAMIQAKLEAQVVEPPAAEVEEFYAQVQSRAGGRSFEELRPMLVQELQQRQRRTLLEDYLAQVKKDHGLEVRIAMPALPRFDVDASKDPAKGPDKAPVTIVEFADFECPYCGRAQETVDRVLDAYEGKVRVVFRDYPLPNHTRAVPAAVAANCAGEQDRYWDMHARLMANQEALSDTNLRDAATALGLDMAKWDACVADPAQRAEVMDDMADGQKLGVDGTPAFYINGVFLGGARPFEQFAAIIDAELAR